MRILGFDITKAAKSNKYWRNIIWKWFFGREWVSSSDQKSLLEAYQSWVYVCASRNATVFATVPLRLYVAKQEKNEDLLTETMSVPIEKQIKLRNRYVHNPVIKTAVEIEEVVEHPLIDLTTQVNDFMNHTDLMELTDLHLELTGNAYWYLVPGPLGVPIEIWPLPPEKMRVVPDPEKFISHYVFITSYGSKVKFERDEIIHFKWPNPRDPYYGMSPLQAVASMYNINYSMNEYEKAMFTNNARPEGFFYTDQEIDDITFERLKTEIVEMWQGIKNVGKTGLLDRNVKFEKVNWSPRDLAFLQGRKWSKAEIFEAYDTPIGLFDEKANRANAEAAQYTYMKFGIAPRLRRFEEKLNERLVPRYDDRLFVAFDEIVPEDKEFRLKEDTELFKIGVKTINEIRTERGLGDIAGGDSTFLPQTFLPLLSAGQNEDATDEIIEELADEIVERVIDELNV